MNAILTKSYEAGAAINPCRFLKFGGADNVAIQASDASAAVIGAAVEHLAHVAGEQVDAVTIGIAFVECGGVVARNAVVIPDADGKAVAASVVPGTEQHVGGVALVAGAAGDIIPVLLTPGAVIATDTGVVSVDVTIATGELLALNATPKQLVAAPGAGKALILVDAQAFLDYNSAAYAGIAAGEDLAIRYTDGSGAQVAVIETTGFLDQTADQHRHVYPLADAAKNPVANAALVAHLLTGEITTGNSPLKMRVRYRVVDVAW